MKNGKPYNVSFAVIGGSGAYHLLSENIFGEELDCKVLDTPFGKSSPIHHFRCGESEFIFLSRHGEKDYSLTAPFVNYKANVYALKACGADRIIAWSGPGIINQNFRPGDFVLPHDVIAIGMFMIGWSTAFECDYRVIGFPTGTTDNPVEIIEMI